MAPDGHLLVVNALDGRVVEIDPANGDQLAAKWIDKDAAQTPPGSGDLFGIVMRPDGKGFLLCGGRREHVDAGAMTADVAEVF